MNTIVNSPMFGITLTFLAYEFGILVTRKVRSPLLNPMVIAAALCIGFLQLTGIPLESYQVGGDFLIMLIFPATTCIAVSVYSKIDLLKQHFVPIVVGCTVGAATSIGSVILLAKWLGLPDILTVSMAPKSVTTAIAIEISALLQGQPSLTVMAVMITGITGVLSAPVLIKLFRITDPIIQGVALGTSSHVIGTAKALELGQTQGAMGGISIFITGLATVGVVALTF